MTMLADTMAPNHTKNTSRRSSMSAVDAKGLAARLKRRIDGEVRFDDGNRALYASDASNYRQVPIGVVIPRNAHDVMETIAACREFGAPVLPRGAGTSLAGQCCNVAVVLDFSKYMNRVLEIDSNAKLARVEPGCVLDDLRAAAAKHGLIFGPDPATHSHCALGGMLGNNSCGVHSLLSSNHGLGMRTSDNTHELDILTYEGERMTVGPTSAHDLDQIIRTGDARGKVYERLRDLRNRHEDEIRRRFPKLPRLVSGYLLNELLPEHNFHVARSLVGTEGTCVITLGATLHLVPMPKARALVVLGYPDVYSAADHLMEILEHKPIGLEGIDRLLVHWLKSRGQKEAHLKLLPPGQGWLLVEFDGETQGEADGKARKLCDQVRRSPNAPAIKTFDSREEEEMVWKVRESGLGATAWNPGEPDNWPGFEDSAVPPDRVAEYLRDLRKLMEKYDYKTSLYGHFGQGCIHCRIPFDLYSAQGVRKYQSFMEEATDLVMRYGGSISGEHGDGQARGQFLSKMYGDELVQAFRDFKRIWDPRWKMNPGKVIDANPITSNLRIGADYNPPDPPVHFKYPRDNGTLARAALRCVGIGDCRKKGGQTMCPSYMVTMEEMHSTRGRARLLWEMLNGNAIKDGWRSGAVKEALDLCLSCKGCKSDCPVNVDMATYKAEFLSHYYKGRIRPRHAYAFGYVHLWSRMANLVAPIANFFSQTPVLSGWVKWIGGVAQERQVPPFAPESFKAWFRKRGRRNSGCPPVLMFADTFTNYFQPQVARAAVEVLEHAGFHVEVPEEDMCCGRPLYDYGMLGAASDWLKDVLRKLRPALQAGTPMVVLEPSCCAVFRDELPELFPNDVDGERLARNTFTLAEFLEKHAPDWQVPRLNRHAVVHRHCHHKAVMGFESDRKLLERMGLEIEVLESGCCGLAGSFGFEPGEHYRVSIACGERVLLPAVRQARSDDLILTDGFSCRTQIAQNTNREALHMAEVIQLALREGPRGPLQAPPEHATIEQRRREHRRANTNAIATVAGLAAAGFLASHLFARRRRR